MSYPYRSLEAPQTATLKNSHGFVLSSSHSHQHVARAHKEQPSLEQTQTEKPKRSVSRTVLHARGVLGVSRGDPVPGAAMASLVLLSSAQEKGNPFKGARGEC